MKRRSFLQGLVALVAAPVAAKALPDDPVEESPSRPVLHPEVEKALNDLAEQAWIGKKGLEGVYLNPEDFEEMWGKARPGFNGNFYVTDFSTLRAIPSVHVQRGTVVPIWSWQITTVTPTDPPFAVLMKRQSGITKYNLGKP